ncbi:MAG: MFS transporter [Chloroflexi bacterium]|nr:MFS transporter [Chloroflexota bacterium]
MKLRWLAALGPDPRGVLSWALYDFANTIFSMNIVTLYFALWVTVDHSAPDLLYSVAFSGSMLATAVTAPMLGAVSDRYGRRIPFLLSFTLLCVVAVASIGVFDGLALGLLAFAVGNFGYQSGLIFYDALIGTVSTPDIRGRVSGLGVALGYVGAILGILMVKPFVDAGGRSAAFVPTAVLFLVFAIPCFLWVREQGPTGRWRFGYLREGYQQLFTTLRNARKHGPVLRFILARFFYVDAINTVIAFMGVYAVKVLGFADGQLQQLLILSTVFAAVGSFAYGALVDRIGPKRTLGLVLVQWALVLLAVAATSAQAAFYAIGAVIGVGLGATWTADRVFLTRLAPPEQAGEFFGLYGLAGRFASVVGPMVWGLTLWTLGDFGTLAYRIGVLVLLGQLLVGAFILIGVRQQPAGPAGAGAAGELEAVRPS